MCIEVVHEEDEPTPDLEQFLQVVVVPHSHCDPGWWFTFEEYHELWASSILDSIVALLEAQRARRFVFAEVAFVQRWWAQQTPGGRARLRAVVQRGQLELVTGGWVMHDEVRAPAVSVSRPSLTCLVSAAGGDACGRAAGAAGARAPLAAR